MTQRGIMTFSMVGRRDVENVAPHTLDDDPVADNERSLDHHHEPGGHTCHRSLQRPGDDALLELGDLATSGISKIAVIIAILACR